VLELAYGSAPPDQEDVSLPEHALDVSALSWRELQVVAAKLIADTPSGDGDGGADRELRADRRQRHQMVGPPPSKERG
jgi:hypothetical protein